MHTRAFGDYRGPEEVMLRTSNYTEINLIDNYGTTARVDFKVVDTALWKMLWWNLKSTIMANSTPL